MNVTKTSNGGRVPVAALAVAGAAVAWAAYQRFGTGFYYLHRFYMLMACFLLGLAALASLWRWLSIQGGNRPRRLAAAGVFAGAIGLIVLMGHESPAANLRKNRAYLERLAGIAAEYTAQHGEAPDQFDQAYDEAHRHSGVILPNRGDADGHGLLYQKLGKRAFALTSERAGVRVDYRDGTTSTRAEAPRDLAPLTRR